MSNLSSYSVELLERAVAIKRQIEALTEELDQIEGNGLTPAKRRGRPNVAVDEPVTLKRKKRHMSPEAKAKIAEAQKARWAKVKGIAAATPEPTPAAEAVTEEPKKKRKVSRAAKAKMAAAQKARWEKVRAEKAAAA